MSYPLPLARAWFLASAGLLSACAQMPTDQSGGIAALLGTSTASNATDVGTPTEIMARGDAALAAGDTDRALFEYLRALNKGGDDAAALHKIGVIHAARGNDDLAENAYRRALAIDHAHAGALTGFGILLTRQRRYAEAETQLLAALRSDPKTPAAHNGLGVLADLQGAHRQAQAYYLDGLVQAPDSAILLNNLGYSYYLAGNNKAAITQFRAALAQKPNYAMAWRNLGLVYTRQGRYEEALAAFNKVQDLPQAYNDVGYIAMVAGKLDDAQSFFDEALRLSPEYYPTAGENARRVRTLKGK